MRPESVDSVRTAAGLTAAGVAGGLGATVYLVRFVRGLLVGVEPFDPVSFTCASAAIVAAAGLAAYIPARRAAKADPMATLRYE